MTPAGGVGRVTPPLAELSLELVLVRALTPAGGVGRDAALPALSFELVLVRAFALSFELVLVRALTPVGGVGRDTTGDGGATGVGAT